MSMQSRFSPSEWEELKLLPFLIFRVVALEEGGVSRERTGKLVEDLERGPRLENALHRELFTSILVSDVGALARRSQEVEDPLAQLSHLRAKLQDSLTDQEYQEFVASVTRFFVELAGETGASLTRHGRGLSDLQRKALELSEALFQGGEQAAVAASQDELWRSEGPPAEAHTPAAETRALLDDAEAGPAESAGETAFPPATSTRGHWGPQRGPARDSVDCTVFAPPEAMRSAWLLIQVFAHLPKRAGEAQRMAEEFDDEAKRRVFKSLGTEIERGSVLRFELRMHRVEIDDPVQELIWQGRTESVQFGAGIPADAPPGSLIGQVLISQNSVPIGQVRFKLKVLGFGSGPRRALSPAGEASRYETAFISYASKDREEVLRRVQMLSAVGIRYFQDVMDLEPGILWERELYRVIDESDVMFLFWSAAAKESEWVEREWRYGLERRGEDFIRPVILEGPPVPLPPPELSHLHFSDRVVYFLQEA